MHDINYSHQHELIEHDFLGCCKNLPGQKRKMEQNRE